MAILSIQNLTKFYKKRKIIKGINIKVNTSEIVGLLGPNGSGKTTTFYIIAGIVMHDDGQILINETDISYLPLHIRSKYGIGYLPQEPSIFRKLTVFDNLMAIVEMRKDLSYEEKKNYIKKLMKEFRISHLYNNFGISLSGGERRRVEIARAISNNPKFILLDEPFSGVDPISIFDVKKIIKYLSKTIGLGILITDHNVRETLGICDKAYVINQGEILAYGSPIDILYNKEVKKNYLGEEFKI